MEQKTFSLSYYYSYKVKDIHKKISQKVILTKINSLNKNFKLVFKRKPKIGILGLNPHNAEMSSNSEEKNNFTSNKKIN